MKQNKKIFLALTAYDGRVDVFNMLSILNNVKTLEQAGYEVKLEVVMGDCYICGARSKMCKSFLETDFDNMVFIDNDLSFDANAILKLIQAPVQIIGGTYPYRGEKEGFPVEPLLDSDGCIIGNKELGIIECKHIPTGLMRIRRDVFSIIRDKFPQFKDFEGLFRYFITGIIFDGDTRWFGEDVAFCEMARQCGIKIWCEPRLTFGHMGRAGRVGCFDTYLRNNAKEKINGEDT